MGKGLGAIKEANEGSVHNLKIKNGESKVIRILTPPDEIISVWEHVEQLAGGWKTVTCLGKQDCPLCKAGKKASFKSYIAVLDRDDNKVKIFKASKKVGVQLLGLLDEYGDLRARDFKIFRQGDKLDTTYQFFPRDPSAVNFDDYELPDIEEMVALKSKDEILELMAGGSVDNNDSEETGEGEETGEDKYPF
jgi:hypothetical protein